MDPKDRESALTILTTEHHTLQMVRSATITDASSRAGHLLATISASTIALGFIAQVAPVRVLLVLMLVIFTGLFLIGLATLFRTVELSIEDLRCGVGINRIRHVYGDLVPSTREVFVRQIHDDTEGVDVDAGQTAWRRARRPRVVGGAFSVSGVVNLVNGLVAGAAAGAAAALMNSGVTLAVVVGVVVAVVTTVAFGLALSGIWRRGVSDLSIRYPRNAAES